MGLFVAVQYGVKFIPVTLQYWTKGHMQYLTSIKCIQNIWKLTVVSEGDDQPVIISIVTLDQVALKDLMRRIWSLGKPLFSVNCVDWGRW